MVLHSFLGSYRAPLGGGQRGPGSRALRVRYLYLGGPPLPEVLLGSAWLGSLARILPGSGLALAGFCIDLVGLGLAWLWLDLVRFTRILVGFVLDFCPLEL